MESKKINKYLSFIMVLLLTLLSVPIDAYAANTAAYLAVTIDTSSNTYRGTVFVSDEWSRNNNPEKKLLDEDDRPLSFPNDESDMTVVDSMGIEFANNILVSSLNAALYKINGGDAIEDLDELRSLTYALLNGREKNGYTISRGVKSGKVYLDLNYDIDQDGRKETLDDDDFITISKSGEETVSYACRMKKYTSNDNDRTEYITWKDMTVQAWKYFDDHQITAANIGNQVEKPNILSRMISSAVSGIVSGLEVLLGLFSIPDLVFNEGTRGSAMYVYGVFPSGWQNSINVVFMIFQAIGWVSILLSIISLVFRKNLASMTTSVRVDVIVGVQRLILVGLMLVMLFPVLNMVLKFSYLLTDVFSNVMSPEAKSGFYASIPKYGNGIAAILVGIAHFGASLLINIQYIIRAVIVALLIAASPLFIVFITFGESYKKITIEWAKMLLSNIFIQPINALVLGFLMSVPYVNIRGIEALVFVYAMLPISEIIREMIFQRGGTTAKVAGNIAKSTATGLIAMKTFVVSKNFERKLDKFFSSSGEESEQVKKDREEVEARDRKFERAPRSSRTPEERDAKFARKPQSQTSSESTGYSGGSDESQYSRPSSINR